MGTRLELQTRLEKLLGSKEVYYQSPENSKINYPAIIYSINNIESNNADNIKYSKYTCYNVIVIDKLPDNIVISKILEMPYSSYDRHYKSDNFNHDVIKLYF